MVYLETPSAPFLDLTVLSGDSIQANFSAPLSDGGAAIHSYKLDWDTDPGTQEVQYITTATDIGPNEIQVVTTTATDVNAVQLVDMQADSFPEVQRILVSYATGGEFFVELDTSADGGSLQYSGYIGVDYVASGSGTGEDIESIISNMPNVASSGSTVSVARNVIDSNNFEIVVTFPASMGNIGMMVVHTTGLTGTNGAATAVVCDDGNSVCVDGNIVSGTYRLSFQDESTVDLNSDATESQVREALEALSTVGTVDVSRSEVDDQKCYKWTIEFTADMNNGELPLLVADFSNLNVSTQLRLLLSP